MVLPLNPTQSAEFKANYVIIQSPYKSNGSRDPARLFSCSLTRRLLSSETEINSRLFTHRKVLKGDDDPDRAGHRRLASLSPSYGGIAKTSHGVATSSGRQRRRGDVTNGGADPREHRVDSRIRRTHTVGRRADCLTRRAHGPREEAQPPFPEVSYDFSR